MEGRQAVERADKVFYLVTDPISEMWINKINPNSESLFKYYEQGKSRFVTYKEMTQHILKYVRKGLDVCAIFYGHPGVFVESSHESIKIAQKEGFDARMLPGISAEDCLFADLGVDPYTHGCQSFEATSFLVSKRKFDTSSHLILWQIGFVGALTYNPNGNNNVGLSVLRDFLKTHYGSNYEVVVYEAAQFMICKPVIHHILLSELADIHVSYMSTLYIPPKIPRLRPLNYSIVDKLGLS